MISNRGAFTVVSNAEFMKLTIEVMRKLLSNSMQNSLSSGRILEMSQALDELILAYYKL